MTSAGEGAGKTRFILVSGEKRENKRSGHSKLKKETVGLGAQLLILGLLGGKNGWVAHGRGGRKGACAKG